MKKLTALLLALVMVLAMNATAFADGETGLASGVATPTDPATDLSGITFNVNYESKDGVNKAGATFGYTIANGAAIAASTGKPAILAGVDGGATLTNSSVTFPVTVVDGKDTMQIAIDFDESKFDQPGIYRYIIQEDSSTLSTDMQNAGISKGDAYTTAYLDVYVTKVSGTNKVTGAVLNTEIASQNNVDSNAQKIDGFNYNYTVDPDDITTPDPGDDKPESYDVKVSKEVAGNAASTDQEFEFKVSIGAMADGTGVSYAGVKVPYQVYDSADAPKTGEDGEITINASTAQTITVTLKHGEYVKLTGLPKGASITATEDQLDYTPSFAVTEMTGTASGSEPTATASVKAAKLGEMAFTNTRDNISPTGVVLRIAPYAIMLGAGVVLFIILKSRKNKAVEEA